MKKPYVSPRAFSRDGYIINQRLLKNLPYGMRHSDYNGCGWVAAYNFLHACGRQKDYDTVRQQLEDGLIAGGLLGTHIIQLYLYLRRHGFHLHWAWGRDGALRQAQQCKVGILFYFNGVALHFVTFVPASAEEAALARQEEKAMEPDVPGSIDKPEVVEESEQYWYRFFNGRMGCGQDYDTLERFLDSESQTPVLIQLTTKQ